MLARLAARRARSGEPQTGRRGVLVKRPKPGQELRIDLPAIGPGTVERAMEAGLAGIAVQAGGVLAAERARLVRRADDGGLFVQGWELANASSAAAAAAPQGWHATALTPRKLDASQIDDAAKGAGLLTTIDAFGNGRGAIVDRGHVLAVECTPKAWRRCSRSARACASGDAGGRAVRACAVLGQAADLRPSLVNAAATAGLAGTGRSSANLLPPRTQRLRRLIASASRSWCSRLHRMGSMAASDRRSRAWGRAAERTERPAPNATICASFWSRASTPATRWDRAS